MVNVSFPLKSRIHANNMWHRSKVTSNDPWFPWYLRMTSPILCYDSVSNPKLSLLRALESWYFFWLACFSLTHHSESGLSKSRRIRSCLPRNNWLGDLPGVAWGVIRYFKRNFSNWSWIGNGPPADAFNANLKVCTKCSAVPFEAGWQGAVRTWCFKNSSNSAEQNCIPLSETSCLGNPYRTKHSRRTARVFSGYAAMAYSAKSMDAVVLLVLC